MQNFNDLSRQEQGDFLNSIDVVLADGDGVLWRGRTKSGCGEVLNILRKMGKKVGIVTNNSVNTKETSRTLLKSAELDKTFTLDDIINLNVSLVKYLQIIDFRKKIYILGSQPTFDALDEAGYVYDNGANLVSSRLADQSNLDSEVGAVIVDIDFDINYMKIAKAAHYLKRPEVLFIVGAQDKWVALSPTVTILGPGHFTELLVKACNRQPTVIGKPGDELGKMLEKLFNIQDPKRVLFIGDYINQDIVFAHKQGYRSMLVLTGVTDKETAEAGVEIEAKSNTKKVELVRPEFYLDSLSDLLPLLNKL